MMRSTGNLAETTEGITLSSDRRHLLFGAMAVAGLAMIALLIWPGSLGGTPRGPGTALRTSGGLIVLAVMSILALVLHRCRGDIARADAALLRSEAEAREARQALDDLVRAHAGHARADADARARLETLVQELQDENDALKGRLAAAPQAPPIDTKAQLEQLLGPVIDTMQQQRQMLTVASGRVRAEALGLERLVEIATASADQTERHVTGLVPQAAAFARAGEEIEHEASGALAEARRASQDGEQMGASVTALTSALSEIEAVITAIDRLSKQTNLLSLNARIEASRSGEAGAGFAVVANEVKTLANHTADLTRQATGRIEELRHRTVTTSAAIETIVSALARTEAASGVITAAVHRQVEEVSLIRIGIDAVAGESRMTAAAVTHARSAITVSHDAADLMDEAAMDLSATLVSLDSDIAAFLRQLEAA